MVNNCVYLDWAATAPVHYFTKDYYVPGNPNSQHNAGLQANQVLNEARQRIMDCLGVRSGKVLVGGTASQLVDNLMWRIYSLGNYNILCSVYEHDCFNRWLDYRLTEYPTDQISKNDIVCWMMVNNITGTVFNVEQIGKMCRDAGAYYIMDAVASIGHYPISNNLESFCDCFITSAHKYGGPQGTGCMWVSDRFAKFLELSNDSHEEYGLIHGTPNVSAAVAMSLAMRHAVREAKTNNIVWGQLVNYMCTKLLENNVLHHIHDIENEHKTHAINALYLPKFNSDALVQFLSSRNVYVSPCYSACSDNANYRVAEALGMTKEEASQTIRVSFGEGSSPQDVDKLIEGIIEFKSLFM